MGRIRIICDHCVRYNGRNYLKDSSPFLVDEVTEKDLVEAGLAESVVPEKPIAIPTALAPKPVAEKVPESAETIPDPEPVPEAKQEPEKQPIAVPRKRRAKTRAKKKVRKK